jgi:hypothetical protein
VQLLERHFLAGIDGVCETPSVEPPWLLITMPFNPKKYTSIGRFQLSISISPYGYQRESLGLGAKLEPGIQGFPDVQLLI